MNLEPLGIKVGDTVELRNGEVDLIVAEVKINSLPNHDFRVLSKNRIVDYFDSEQYPFISKTGRTYTRNGKYYWSGGSSSLDIVRVIREKKTVKKYRWIINGLIYGGLHITDGFYSEDEAKEEYYLHSILQKIDSTMKEVEVKI